MNTEKQSDSDLLKLKEKFIQLFGEGGQISYYFSPGRVNLIGEHTDYNGGYVFPASITIGTTGLARLREDTKIRLYSTNFSDQGVYDFDLSEINSKEEGAWVNYVKGMLVMLKEAGWLINQGFELLVEGKIPTASGLSSSASLELLSAVVLDDLFSLNLSRLELVKLGQKVENDFINVNSGILDQFAIGFGEENKAILLDCNNLEYEMIPCELGDYKIVIMNTKKSRALTESKYNERFSETRKALKRLQEKLDIQTLAELSNEVFDQNMSLLKDETLIKRARHAVYENNRTKLAKEAFVSGDLKAFGQMLNDSHTSLKEDYEVTGLELDTLVEQAQAQDKVLGARMTGAGFGGCAIALVSSDSIDSFIKNVGQAYEKVVGYPAEFYLAEIGAGARKLEMK